MRQRTIIFFGPAGCLIAVLVLVIGPLLGMAAVVLLGAAGALATLLLVVVIARLVLDR